MDNTYGLLYICATPIGNLSDITLRTLDTLKSADYIACEDTRHTLKLLTRFEIKKRLISCHEHNEYKKSAEIIALLKEGARIAYVSDAGMPAVSDPGGRLIAECIKEGINVTVCPGASALLAALVLSGMPDRFVFEGFLPRVAKERREILSSLKNERRTIILYEAPHRLKKTLSDILTCLGDRKIAIARELTKLHEEVFRATVSAAIREFEQRDPRGEFVLVINGSEIEEDENHLLNLSIFDHVSHYTKEGLTETEAIKQAAKDRKIPKREVYRAVKISE